MNHAGRVTGAERQVEWLHLNGCHEVYPRNSEMEMALVTETGWLVGLLIHSGTKVKQVDGM